MEDLIKSIDFIKEKNGIINNLNILFKFKDKKDYDILNYLKEKLNCINTFKNLKDIFLNLKEEELKYINYFMIYSVKDVSFNNIFFNPNVIENSIELKKKDQFLIKINIKNSNCNTENIKLFIEKKNNFIHKFLLKQSRKNKLSVKEWKNINFNKDFSNISENNKKYTISNKKKTIIEIDKEKIITNVRLSIPNSLTIQFIDNSYIFINKIIISKTLILDNIIFNTIKDKIDFFINFHKKLFNFDNEDIKKINYILSLKYKNEKDNINFTMFDDLKKKNNNISFSKTNIVLKYIKTYEELKKAHEIIENCIKKKDKKINILKEIDKKELFYFNDEKINYIFDFL